MPVRAINERPASAARIARYLEGRPALVLAQFMNRADVWMIERGRRASFTLEAFLGNGIGEHFGRQELDRNLAAEPLVFGAIDHSHPAAAELLNDPVMRNSFARH